MCTCAGLGLYVEFPAADGPYLLNQKASSICQSGFKLRGLSPARNGCLPHQRGGSHFAHEVQNDEDWGSQLYLMHTRRPTTTFCEPERETPPTTGH